MADKIGFIGVGTMGEPMCRNLAKKSGLEVLAADRDQAPLKRLDLIFCQNVLIYFARERRAQLLDALAQLLKPGGLLVVGPGEVLGFTHSLLTRVGGPQTLAFQRKA